MGSADSSGETGPLSVGEFMPLEKNLRTEIEALGDSLTADDEADEESGTEGA